MSGTLCPHPVHTQNKELVDAKFNVEDSLYALAVAYYAMGASVCAADGMLLWTRPNAWLLARCSCAGMPSPPTKTTGHLSEAREEVDRLLRKNPDHRYANELHLFVKDAQGASSVSSTVICLFLRRTVGHKSRTFAYTHTITQPSRTSPWGWAWGLGW